jgi:hypothetical protein
LLIHILANVATNMSTSKTTLGRVPAAFKIRVAVMTSRRVFDNTAAMVKPPIRSMIVGENICEKMYLSSERVSCTVHRSTSTHLVASDAVMRRSASLSVRNTRKNTTSSGTESEVTNNGIACP